MTEKPQTEPEVTGSAQGGSAAGGKQQREAADRVVVQDKQKIDSSGGEGGPSDGAESADVPTEAAEVSVGEPAGGEVESPEVQATAAEAPAAARPAPEKPAEGGLGPLGAELEAVRAELDERTRDLQRVSAEYANYRKRVDRDRGVAAEQTTGVVLGTLLPVLDDLDRAREHGDLVGPFATVAEQLTVALGKFGLTAFGEKGDPFDPTRHEAVAHLTSADVTESTCIDVMRRGYLLGDRLLRPALVAVADPE
jgi:molecular chaperone GrpE